MLPLFDTSALVLPELETDGRFMSVHERRVLVALANSIKAEIVIEIGVQEGRAAKYLLANVPSITSYIGIDVLPGYVPSLAVQLHEVPAEPGHLVKHDARFRLQLRKRGSLDLVPSNLPFCDLVLIDGDHGRQAVLHDSALARDSVLPGGLIVWHDYYLGDGACEVRDVLDEMHAAGDLLARIDNTWFAVERR
jgi:predicted O-methyltransferase YrrM